MGAGEDERRRVATLRKALHEIKATIQTSDSPYALDAERGYLHDLIEDALLATDLRRRANNESEGTATGVGVRRDRLAPANSARTPPDRWDRGALH